MQDPLFYVVAVSIVVGIPILIGMLKLLLSFYQKIKPDQAMIISTMKANPTVAFEGANGSVLWDQELAGPVSLHPDYVLAAASARDYATGEPLTTAAPISGAAMPFPVVQPGECGGPGVGNRFILTGRMRSAQTPME